jgi:hypothetical protein
MNAPHASKCKMGMITEERSGKEKKKKKKRKRGYGMSGTNPSAKNK